jgi:hypothetical protein
VNAGNQAAAPGMTSVAAPGSGLARITLKIRWRRPVSPSAAATVEQSLLGHKTKSEKTWRPAGAGVRQLDRK